MARKRQKEVKEEKTILPVEIKRLNPVLGAKGPHALYREDTLLCVESSRDKAYTKALLENRSLGFSFVRERFE